MKLAKALIFVGLSCSLWSCASEGVRFDAVGPDNQLAPQARYLLSADRVREATVIVESWGRMWDQVNGRDTDTVRFRLTVENPSEDAVSIPLDRLSAGDDQGHRYLRAGDFLPGDQSPPMFVVPAGQRTSFETTFDAGAPGVLNTTGAVNLGWSYSYRGQAVEHSTRFLPVRYVRYVEHHYVGFGFTYWPCRR